MFRLTSISRSAATLAATILITITGCAGVTGQANAKQAEVPESDVTQQRAHSPATRRAFGAAQATQNLIQTFAWDPIVRPYSTVTAVGSIALKSIGATMRRAVVTVRMPVPGESPAPLSYAEPMDLNDWEQDLDRILGKKASTGKIHFLIDGDEVCTTASSMPCRNRRSYLNSC